MEFKKFFKKVVAGNSPEREAVGELYRQREEDKSVLHPDYKELYKQEEEILDAHREQILARISALDAQGVNKLDLSDMIPDIKKLLGNPRAVSEPAKDGLATTIRRWLERETGTRGEYIFGCQQGAKVDWFKGQGGIPESKTLH